MPSNSAAQRPIEKLKGYNIRVRGNKGEVIEGYCRLLEQAGLIVRCSPNDSDSVKHSIYLGCATLPKDAGELIQAYLGIGGYKVHDWRNHEDFGAKPGGYCDEFDAIDLASYE